MISRIDLLKQLHGVDLGSQRKHLPDMGSSIDIACCELARDMSLDKLDRLAARLNSGQTTLQHLRKSLISDRVVTHGHGTG
jgi:hypothetical protein